MARAASLPWLQRLLPQVWLRRGALAWLLWPLAQWLGVMVVLRQHLYRAGVFKAQRVSALVLVVGNVVAGGSGKTPVVMALVRHLQSRGLRVGVISRGYGRRTHDCREVLADSRVGEVGDEPALIQHTTGAPVFVAAHRLLAAQALLARYPNTQIIICDDGLQHLSLQRDLEICTFDDRGVGNGWLLPAGPLREPWPRSVDWVLHTGQRPAFAGFGAPRTLAPYALRADGQRVALEQLMQPGATPLLALAAIAKPEDFFSMLRAAGLTLAHTLALPDHYDFDSFNPNEYKAYTLICTEKDAVKLWPAHVAALAVPLRLSLESAFTAALDERLTTQFNFSLSPAHGHTTS